MAATTLAIVHINWRSFSSRMADSNSAATFIVPLWWMRAFEISLQLRSLETDPYAMSAVGGLAPSLTDAELNAFLVIIQSCQQQILSGQKWLRFDPELLLKNHPAMSKTKSFLFLRLSQMLRSLQVLPNSQSDLKENLFFFEREERRRDSDGSYKTMYRLSNLAPELILGYSEPYSELIRLVEGKARAHRYLGSHEPLSLRPSVWLDLSYLEQYIFLQLRKASLWEENNFRWDAVFGRSFEEIFGNLPLPRIKPRDGFELSPFRQKMKLLRRVGAKLIDHGVLRSAQSIDYLTIDPDGDPLTVIWQLHETEAQLAELRTYEQDVGRYFRETNLESALKKLAVLIQRSEDSFPLLKELEDRERQESVGSFKLEGNLLLSISALYFEWSLRAKSQDAFALPSWIKDSPALRMIQGKGQTGEKLQQFAKLLKDHPEYIKDLQTLPRACVAAPASLRQAEFLERLASASGPAASSHVRAAQTAAMPPRRDAAKNPSPLPPMAAPVAVQKGPDPELEKQATEELHRMRERDPGRYMTLKQKYLEGLELEKKQIILEMKERMQPHAFDDHLRYSLVKYMVDNPRVWQPEDRPSL